MCQKAVRFPSSLEKYLSSDSAKSIERRPSDVTSQQLIESAWEAVLDEQVDQWASGQSDPERMASVYRRHSASCQVKAIVDGLKVHEEAAKCAHE